jgi:TctA family transporter
VRLIRIRYEILGPATLFFAFIGVYAAETNIFEVYVMVIAGVIGYLLRKLRFPEGPLILGLVLGPLLEEQLRRSLTLSLGDPTILISRPISGVIIAIAALCLAWPLFRRVVESTRGTSARRPIG